MLFGRAIDATKSGENVKIPENLRNPPMDVVDASVGARKFVWQQMEHAAKLFKDEFRAREINSGAVLSADYFTEDFVDDLLCDEFTSLTEFQKFRVAFAFCLGVCGEDEDAALAYFTEKFLDKINFSLFGSILEKTFAVDVGVPLEIVGNALNRFTSFKFFMLLKKKRSFTKGYTLFLAHKFISIFQAMHLKILVSRELWKRSDPLFRGEKSW
jgi:hypothetical protein